jgi:hypothetical protein
MSPHRLPQHPNIPVLDVTAVFPEVCGNAISTRQFSQYSRCNRVGFYGSSRLSYGGDVVDIDAKR